MKSHVSGSGLPRVLPFGPGLRASVGKAHSHQRGGAQQRRFRGELREGAALCLALSGPAYGPQWAKPTATSGVAPNSAVSVGN